MSPPHAGRQGEGLHLAVIMDGNGRWATARGLPRTAGHREGARAVRRLVEAAPDLGVDTLTLYAFSSDNWTRPRGEIQALMRLFRRHLLRETPELVEQGVRLSLIGRRDRLPERVRQAACHAESSTAAGTRLHLRLAIDYSARDALTAAAEALRGTPDLVDRAAFQRALAGVHGDAPEVDLLVRTSGEQRLSDFLLWECAYAELLFTPVHWPDVDAREAAEWVRAYHGRERRFGGLGVRVVGG